MSSISAETTMSRAMTVVPGRVSGQSPPRSTRGRTSSRRSRAPARSSRTMSAAETPIVRTAFTGLAK